MKKRIIPIITLLLALTLCCGGAAYAQEEEVTSDPGITPDSPFYFADGWGEQLGLMFAFKAETKTKKALQYAEEKLAEAEAMAARNMVQETARAASQWQNRLTVALQALEETDSDDADTQSAAALAAARQVRSGNDIAAGASEEARGTLTQACDRARECQDTALGNMARGDPEEAALLHLQIMEQQLSRIQAMGETTEPLKLQNALQEFTRLNGLGEGIRQAAEDKGKGAEVGQMYGQAAEHHFQVMAEVHTRLQAHLDQSTEEAMQNCLQNCQQTATKLNTQNQPGPGPQPEETPGSGSASDQEDKGQTGSGGNSGQNSGNANH